MSSIGAGSGNASPKRRDGVTPLGSQLRAERERRGTRLEQVAEATKIRTTYLEALEAHDWKVLPADVFTRGYVRSYAEYLGLDQEHLLKVYARERRLTGVDDPSTSERAILERLAQTHGVDRRRTGMRIKWIALGLSGSAIAALAVWALLPSKAEAPSYLLNAVAAPPPPTAEELPAPPPVPAPAPPVQAEPSSASHLKVAEFGVGTGIVDHQLVGRGDRFREGTVVWFWTSVLGGQPGDKIRHVWLHDGRSVAVADLNVNGTPWRTQSRRPLPEGSTGDWTVEARDQEGHVIASVGFTCVAAE